MVLYNRGRCLIALPPLIAFELGDDGVCPCVTKTIHQFLKLFHCSDVFDREEQRLV